MEVAKEEEEGEKEEELVKQPLGWWSHTAPNHANPSSVWPPRYYTSLGLVSFRRDQSSKKERRQKIHLRGSQFQINLFQEKSIF